MTINKIMEAIRNHKIRYANYLKANLYYPAYTSGLKTIMT